MENLYLQKTGVAEIFQMKGRNHFSSLFHQLNMLTSS